jgi:hypothetical protein
VQQHTVLLESRWEVKGRNHKGFTSRYFASRPDLISVDIREVKTRLVTTPPGGLIHDITGLRSVYPENLRASDSVIEECLSYEKSPLCLCGEPIRNWYPVMGVYNGHVDFSTHWADWVMNPKIQNSAEEYIVAAYPNAKTYLFLGRHWIRGLTTRLNDYLEVARLVLRPKQVKMLLEKTCCRYVNEVSISAMPIRIAERMNTWPRWVPPFAKPAFQNPIANLELVVPRAPSGLVHQIPASTAVRLCNV